VTTLSGLLSQLGGESPERVVALTGEQERTVGELLSDVGALSNGLREREEREWGIYLEDAFDFLTAFLALLQAGKRPILLPNKQPDFLERLDLQAVLLQGEFEALKAHWNKDIPGAVSGQGMSLYTSGSTGKPKEIGKTLNNLEAEIQNLETVFGSQLADAVVLSTVSHQHIYGLLFQVLWPVCAGRVFDSRAQFFPSDLKARMEGFPRFALISSPSHLQRLDELLDLQAHREQVCALFSSGGPLQRSSALRLSEVLNQGVVEVFGSTETGGVAYRTQSSSSNSHLWTSFPEIELRIGEDGCLCLRSPYIDTTRWFRMDDRVRFAEDGRFELLGRADRVVKVEGKRVSLREVEERLQASPLVGEAGAVLLQGRRSYLGVVLVPSEEGKDRLGELGVSNFKSLLKAELAGYFERVVLPRKWRIVSSMPRNSLGKTTQESLQNLFSRQNITTEPTVVSVKKSDNTVEMELHISDSLPYFDGHFPGRPVLPGVAQVDWAACLGKSHLDVVGEFQGLEALKFFQFILPDSKVNLTLTYKPDKQKLYFSYQGDSGKYSSGRIVFGSFNES